MPDINITTLAKSEPWLSMSPGACVAWITILIKGDKEGFMVGSKLWLARIANIDPAEIDGFIKELEDHKVLIVTEDGFQCLDSERYFWENRNAIKQRAYRARKKAAQEGGQDVG